jgi:hypothetical protein
VVIVTADGLPVGTEPQISEAYDNVGLPSFRSWAQTGYPEEQALNLLAKLSTLGLLEPRPLLRSPPLPPSGPSLR